MDPVRVLADLSNLVVGRILDRDDDRTAGDPFGRAYLQYRDRGAPATTTGWRHALSSAAAGSDRAASVLKRLTRDLLAGISATHEPEAPSTEPEAEVPPENVRPITDAQVPAFELASDGTWKPSAAPTEDAGARARGVRRGSRYPEL
jgi:hypothetical protein